MLGQYQPPPVTARQVAQYRSRIGEMKVHNVGFLERNLARHAWAYRRAGERT